MFRADRLRLLGLLSLSAAAVPAVHAQINFAAVQGTITDAAGASVASAAVTITNTSTGITTNTKTNSRGFYTFPQLQIGGPYTITVDAQGFKKFESTGILLNLNDNRTIDSKLDVGSTAESVQVTAQNGQVETADTQLKSVINAQQIEQLPLLGRDAASLQKLQAGSVESSDRFGTFSANGSQTPSNSFVLDGIDINDGPLQSEGIMVNLDALAEETIVTSTINPEFARNSGAIVNQIIKSGNNKLHGSGFEFYRDTFLNNGNYFSLPGERPPFHQNDYGGTLGGPVFRNKLFFFLAYEGKRNRTGTTNNTVVPTAAQRTGAFGMLTGAHANTVTPFAIGSCPAGSLWSACFGAGQPVPTSAFDPLALKYFTQFVPQSNNTIDGIPFYNFNTTNTGAQDQGVIRLDYHITQSDSLWASSVFQSSPTTETLPFGGADLPGFGEIDAAHFKLFAADYTHTFSANLLNELQVGYFRFNDAAVEPQQVTTPSSYGFNISSQSPGAGLPNVGIKGLFTLGFTADGPQPRLDTNLRASDTLTLVKGNHQLKFGALIEQFRVSNPFFFNNNGGYSFNGSGQYSSGDPLADFLLGIPDNYSQSSGGFIDALAYENYFYAQDSWKATPDLQLNYGAALDIETPNSDRQDKGLGIVCFSLSNQTTGVFAGPDAPPGLLYPGDPGCNSAGGPTVAYDHVAPRFGFAWSPSSGPALLLGASGEHAFSVRGGFGIYYNRDQEEGSLQNITAPPFTLNSQGAASIGLSPGFQNPFADVAGRGSIANPFPSVTPPSGSTLNWANYTNLQTNSFARNYRVPYVYNFNLNIQRQLPSNILLQVGYVGSLGRKLVIAYEGDPITPAGHAACVADTNGCAQDVATHLDYPQYASQPAIDPQNGAPYYLSVGTQGTEGASNYNSAQVTVSKEPTHGLQFTVAYTYSKALDNASGLESSGFNGRGYNQYPGGAALNYGPSDFDARQRLVSSYVYAVPVSRSENAILREALSGWEIAGVTALQGGNPINFTQTGVFLSKWCDEFSYYSCPDTPNVSTFRIPKLNLRAQGNALFNPNLFSSEALGTFGNVGRGLLHGPGFNYTNLTIAKNFPVSADGARFVQLRMDVANAFNHANFAQPDSNYGDSSFGVVSSVRSSADPNGDPEPGRAVQLVGKFYF